MLQAWRNQFLAGQGRKCLNLPKIPLTFLSLPNSSKSHVLPYFISFVFYHSYFTSNHIQNPENAAYMRCVGGCLCVRYMIQYGDLHKGSRLAGWCTWRMQILSPPLCCIAHNSIDLHFFTSFPTATYNVSPVTRAIESSAKVSFLHAILPGTPVL